MRSSDNTGMQSSDQNRGESLRQIVQQRGERLVFAQLLMALGALVSAATAEPRTALVIGNGAYAHAPPLVNPLNDARDVAADLKALARVEAPESMLIPKPGSTASDNPGGRNGLFTEHLRTVLKRPGVDVEVAFSEVVKGVYHDSGQEQYPWKEGVLLSRFYFVPPEGAPVPAAPHSPTAAELEFWRSANACGSDACLQSYLQAYPGGRFAPLAHAKLKHSDEDTTVARETIPFTVKKSPEGVRVRILNIKPKYEDGIRLKPGKYRIEVTHRGYEKHLSWFDLTAESGLYYVALDAVSKPQPSVSQTQRPHRSEMEPEMVSIRGGCFEMG